MICCCGSPLDGSHDHYTCGPPIDEEEEDRYYAGVGMTIVDALEINAYGTGDLRRQAWERGKWLEFKDSKIVNPEILTTDDLRANDWCWSEY